MICIKTNLPTLPSKCGDCLLKYRITSECLDETPGCKSHQTEFVCIMGMTVTPHLFKNDRHVECPLFEHEPGGDLNYRKIAQIGLRRLRSILFDVIQRSGSAKSTVPAPNGIVEISFDGTFLSLKMGHFETVYPKLESVSAENFVNSVCLDIANLSINDDDSRY